MGKVKSPVRSKNIEWERTAYHEAGHMVMAVHFLQWRPRWIYISAGEDRGTVDGAADMAMEYWVTHPKGLRPPKTSPAAEELEEVMKHHANLSWSIRAGRPYRDFRRPKSGPKERVCYNAILCNSEFVYIRLHSMMLLGGVAAERIWARRREESGKGAPVYEEDGFGPGDPATYYDNLLGVVSENDKDTLWEHESVIVETLLDTPPAWAAVEALAKALLKKRSIEGSEVAEIINRAVREVEAPSREEILERKRRSRQLVKVDGVS